ncbi:hypothetical protein BLX90_17140 [Rhizobium sp. Y9]|nr:hypothetical protein BLX90_17140 [Rhizobium sp. Y9]
MTAKINDAIILLGRLSISALFLQAGVGKLFEISGFAVSFAAKGVEERALPSRGNSSRIWRSLGPCFCIS